MDSKKVAFYLRVSTTDQSTDNQLRDLKIMAERLNWNVVQVFCDHGISGAKDRKDRPEFDALMQMVSRREIEMVASWSVDRIGRSLSGLVQFMEELREREVDLYLHQQNLDTSTHMGRAMFAMCSIFADMERHLIRERVVASLERAKENGVQLGRPKTSEWKRNRIRKALLSGKGVRETANIVNVSPATVSRIRKQMS
ncbi:recombinase family protein [Terasakiella sp.]|uniref:recombinase family protein n=1 Tax=Terasakiella sp. TaxID=2034861 RepID=UPI003AA7FED8